MPGYSGRPAFCRAGLIRNPPGLARVLPRPANPPHPGPARQGLPPKSSGVHRGIRATAPFAGIRRGFAGVLWGFGGSPVDVRWGNDGVGVINGPPGGFVASYGFKKKLLPPTTTASCEGEGWGDRKPREPHRFPIVPPPDHHRTTSTTEAHGTNCHQIRPKPMNHHRPDYPPIMRADNPRGMAAWVVRAWQGAGCGGLMGRGLEARGGARGVSWGGSGSPRVIGPWWGVSGPGIGIGHGPDIPA